MNHYLGLRLSQFYIEQPLPASAAIPATQANGIDLSFLHASDTLQTLHPEEVLYNYLMLKCQTL